MVSGLTPEEQAVRAVAAAVNGLPVKTQPAWHRVWARVNSGTHRTASRWPTMAGVSVFVSTLLLALHFNFVGPLHPPTVAAQTVPGPQRVLNLTATQVAAQQQPVNGSTAVPQPGVVGTPAPVPPPPGHS